MSTDATGGIFAGAALTLTNQEVGASERLTNMPSFSPAALGIYAIGPVPGSLDYTNPVTFERFNSTRDGQNDRREIQFAPKLYS